MTGDRASDRGKIFGYPSAAVLFGVILALGMVLLGWSYFPSGSAHLPPTSLQVTGKPTRLYVVADANIRDRATSMGSNIVGKLVPGNVVEGVVETGQNGGYLWLRLSDGSGFVSTVNLSSVAPSATAAQPETTGNSSTNDVASNPEEFRNKPHQRGIDSERRNTRKEDTIRYGESSDRSGTSESKEIKDQQPSEQNCVWFNQRYVCSE